MNHHGWFLRIPGRSTAPIAARVAPVTKILLHNLSNCTVRRNGKANKLYRAAVLSICATSSFGQQVSRGTFDLSERLIPSLAVGCMTDNAVELNGGDQIFDFMHVNDVVRSLLKAVSRLQTPTERAGRSRSIAGEYLLCSSEHTTARLILSYICSLTSCGSTLNIRPADTRYPTNFVYNNARMRHGFGHNPLYPDIKSGLATYLRSMFDRDIRLLAHSYGTYRAGNNVSENTSLSEELQDRKWPKSMHSDDALPLLSE